MLFSETTKFILTFFSEFQFRIPPSSGDSFKIFQHNLVDVPGEWSIVVGVIPAVPLIVLVSLKDGLGFYFTVGSDIDLLTGYHKVSADSGIITDYLPLALILHLDSNVGTSPSVDCLVERPHLQYVFRLPDYCAVLDSHQSQSSGNHISGVTASPGEQVAVVYILIDLVIDHFDESVSGFHNHLCFVSNTKIQQLFESTKFFYTFLNKKTDTLSYDKMSVVSQFAAVSYLESSATYSAS